MRDAWNMPLARYLGIACGRSLLPIWETLTYIRVYLERAVRTQAQLISSKACLIYTLLWLTRLLGYATTTGRWSMCCFSYQIMSILNADYCNGILHHQQLRHRYAGLRRFNRMECLNFSPALRGLGDSPIAKPPITPRLWICSYTSLENISR